jgi:hypothetical protein
VPAWGKSSLDITYSVSKNKYFIQPTYHDGVKTHHDLSLSSSSSSPKAKVVSEFSGFKNPDPMVSDTIMQSVKDTDSQLTAHKIVNLN